MAEIPIGAFTSRVPHFFDTLQKLRTSIPIESQWVVYIHQFPRAIIEQVLQYEDYIGTDTWTNIRPCITNATADPLQTVKGCIFANQVTIPGESIAVAHAGENYRGGYVRGPLTPNRNEFGNFSANFLETNLSFGDLVLRPWMIMVAHLGLMAREPVQADGTPSRRNLIGNPNPIKTTITVYHLAKAGAGLPPIVRKQFNFYDCVPISVSSEDYTSDPTAPTKMRQVEFLYSYYTMGASDRIASGE